VFKEIGSLAGAVHYTHVHMSLPLASLKVQGVAILDHHDVNMRQTLNVSAGLKETDFVHLDYASGRTLATAMHQYTLQGHLEVSAISRSSVDQYLSRINDFLSLFPASKPSRTFAKMNVVDLDEAILPLGQNKFLVYNDQNGYDAELTCLQAPFQDPILTKGTNTVTIPEFCRLRPRHLVIFPDSSVHLTSDFHTYDWEWTRSFTHTHLFRDPEFSSELHDQALTQIGTLNLLDVFQTAEEHETEVRFRLDVYLLSGFLALVTRLLGAVLLLGYCRARALTMVLNYCYVPPAAQLHPVWNALPSAVRRQLDRSANLNLPFTSTPNNSPQDQTV